MLQNDWIETIKKYTNKKFLPNIDWLKISEYASWYQGKVDSFHTYRLYNGEKFLNMEKLSLQMPKQVCEMWANIIFSDMFEIYFRNDNDTNIFKNIIKSETLKNKLTDAVEKSFALSFGVLVASVENLLVGEKTGFVKAGRDSKIKIRFYSADKVIPITIEDEELIECAFVTSNEEKTAISIYRLNDKKEYNILNLLFENDKRNTPIEMYEFNTGYKNNPFCLVKPNLCNNSFGRTMLGMSIYGNSIDTFKAIDDAFDGFYNEIILSRKRLFLSTDAYDMIARTDESGNPVMQRSFDVNSSLFYRLVNDEKDRKNTIQDVSSNIRDGSYGATLKYFLNLLGKQVGFGNNYFKFENEKVYQSTTTVATANQELMKNFHKHTNYLKEQIKNLILYIKHLNNNFTLNGKFTDFISEDVVINFDDSVIESTEEKKLHDLKEVEMNIMSIEEYRSKWYNESDDLAEETYKKQFKYDLINKYLPALESGAMPPEEFARIVYGKNASDELIDYIKNNIGVKKEIVEENKEVDLDEE